MTKKGMPEEQLLNPDELETPRPYPAPNYGQPRPVRPTNGHGAVPVFGTHATPERPAPPDPAARRRRFSINPDSFAEVLLRRWYVVFLVAAIMLAFGVLAGMTLWKNSYLATAQLMRNDPGAVSELFKPQDLSTETLTTMIRSPEVLRRTGDRLQPRQTPRQVSSRLKIEPERGTEITNVIAGGANRMDAVNLANIFCEEAVRYTKELQRVDAAGSSVYVGKQLAEAESDLKKLRNSLPASINAAVPSARSNERLDAAREELATLLVRYTEQHPLVREQRAKVAILTEQANAAAKPAGGPPPQEYEVAIGQLRTLESNFSEVLARHRVVQLVQADPPGYFRLTLSAAPEEVAVKRPWMKIGALSVFLCLLGVAFVLGHTLSREFLDNRLKTPADVARVTQLPVLATLGDVKRLPVDEQNAWAFRTWINVQGRLTRSNTRGLICGVTSARKGDGRSTWIRLLAHAAGQCGYRVLTITTTPADARAAKEKPLPPEEVPPSAATASNTPPKPAPPGAARNGSEASSLSTNVLTTPTQIAEKLKSPDSQPMVHIPLPGWVWNLDRRKQWHSALELWRKIDNVVILVELPPASVPEAVLLAENVPHVLWLADGRSDALETRNLLETLRHGRCNLVGAVLNRAHTSLFEGRFARWFSCFAALATLSLSAPDLTAQAAPPSQPSYMQAPDEPRTSPAAPAPSVTEPAPSRPAEAESAPRPGSFSVSAKTARADWQKRLTLGPGDVLNLGLYGQPELARDEVPISPDGTISYLEAHNIKAAGLTVDEFREKLTEALSQYRRSAQPLVQPVAFRSKKYFVLGKVVQKGVFPLDRPVTVIEAVARARGLETGLAERNLVELADLSRSFLSRRGQKVPVNFEKLFLEGDLTQNVPLEPDDYLYFPATDLSEVYVLGEVRNPGANVFASGAGAVSAIAARGGFTERAWSKRLLVIRGSLNKPETFVVNANDVLLAKSPDFKLQPRDIVYVSHRPWIRAEELLDTVATAFVEAAVVTWTGQTIYDDN